MMVGRVLEEETMDIDYGGFFIKTIGATFFCQLGFDCCHHHHFHYADSPSFKLKEVSVRLTDCQKKLSPKKVT